jgi:RNA polymerase sigma factor (sigma-70 family)
MLDFDSMTDEELLTAYYNEKDEDRGNEAFAVLDEGLRAHLFLSLTRPGYNQGCLKLPKTADRDEVAEELVGVTLAKLADTRGRPTVRWTRERGRVRTWALGILRNVTLSYLREKGCPIRPDSEFATGEEEGIRPDSTQDPGPAPEEGLKRQAVLTVLDECLTELPEELRTVCELLFRQGLKQNEIAERLRTSNAGVTRRKRLAFQRLAQCLRNKGVSPDILN